MKLIDNINQIVSLSSAHAKDGRNLSSADISIISEGCIIYDDVIEYVGKKENAPKELLAKVKITKNLKGYVVTPELVDSHTHLIFGGNRAREYSMRLNGADYQEIANSGGGILESSRGTNSATDQELLNLCSERIEQIHSYGVGTIEIKSGYGLGFEEELRLSQLIQKLKIKYSPKINILNTYMAAHAVPKQMGSSMEYIEKVCIPLLDKLALLQVIDAVDIFHEEGYFDSNDLEKLFKTAKKHNLPVKSHADEFKDNDGAKLAISFDALSVDHLLCTSDEGIKALSKSDTVATLLPGTGFFLGKKQANARKFLDSGVKVAIASDFNPGSCHCDNVLLLASLAAPQYQLNLTELWSSITLNSSHALGLKNQGALVKGLKPRFSIFKANTVDEITYSWGKNLAVSLETI